LSSNTNIGNTPVNQGYVQLIHTGETGGIDGTLRTLYDGDGTASDLQIASNKVKVSTELYIGSKTATEFIQDIVGSMFTTGSYTNITTTYDDTNGNIDLSASGEVTLTGTQTLTNKTLADPTFTGTANGANLTLTGDLTVSGDTIFTNSNTVLIGDAILTLNADETGSPTANAGFEVERGTSTNKSFIWNETDDKWTIGSETFVASTVEANLTGNVTGNVTGSASLNLLKSSNLSDLASASTARSNLGVDAAGTDNSTNVTLVTTSHDYLSLSGQAITLGTIDISDDTNLVGGTGITLTGDTLSTTDSEIVHDNLSGFVSNEHIDHSGVSISAGSGLTGGGNITATRTLSVDINNLDAQAPALELADKIAIYDNSATETNVATLTQLKAIVNTDTNTNQLTTFDVSGDSGTDQTISHGNTLTISGGNGISTSTSATDILSVALGGFSSLTSQSSPDEQDLVVIEEAIGGAIKKVQVGALTSGISFNGSTANGLLTYGNSTTADVESNLTFDGTDLAIAATGKIYLDGGGNTYIDEPSGDQLRLVAGGTEVLKGYSSGAIDMYGGSTQTRSINIGANRSGNGYSYIDLVGDATYSDFGARFIRENGGANTGTAIEHRGTGVLSLNAKDAGSVRFYTSNTERVRIDSSGNMSIGNISPDKKLEVSGDIKISGGDYNGLYFENAAGTTKTLLYQHAATDSLIIKDIVNNADRVTFKNNGSVGIGTTSPGRPLVVNGSSATFLSIVSGASDDGGILFGDSGADYDGQIRYNNASHHMFFKTNNGERMRLESDGDLHLTADVIAFSTTPSDIRLKKNFTKIDNGLDVVSKLEGHTFNWKKGGDRLSAGFKAQEVEKILPHLVDEKKLPLKADDDKEYKILRYEEMIPYLVEAIKEQQEQINKLEEKLNG
jgi:hypothetical protein